MPPSRCVTIHRTVGDLFQAASDSTYEAIAEFREEFDLRPPRWRECWTTDENFMGSDDRIVWRYEAMFFPALANRLDREYQVFNQYRPTDDELAKVWPRITVIEFIEHESKAIAP
jgi:hypothetical protein